MGAGFVDFLVAHAFIARPNGAVNIIGPPFGLGGDSWVIGVNRLADVVGYVNNQTQPIPGTVTTQGFTQTATGSPKLFPVPFSIPTTLGESATPFASGGINSHGAAVLAPANVASTGQSIYIAPDGKISGIEPCQNAAAKAINDKGWVVGNCGAGDAFLWRKALSDGDGGDDEDQGEDLDDSDSDDGQ